MSSHWAPEFGYGMFLNFEEAEAMAKKSFRVKGGITGQEESDTSYWDLREYFDGACSIISREELYDITGVKYLATGNTEEYVEGVMFYGSKSGTVFQDKAESDCYKDIHEMIEEFRETYGKCLPTDFDYEAHMVQFWGANWG